MSDDHVRDFYRGYIVSRVHIAPGGVTINLSKAVEDDKPDDAKTIAIKQDDIMRCCEMWGSVLYGPEGESHTDPVTLKVSKDSPLIGAMIRDVHWHRDEVKHMYAPSGPQYHGRLDSVTLDVETDRGTYQLVVWTDHTGHESHDYRANWCDRDA